MGRLTLLADPCLWDCDIGNAHIIGWKSTMIKRVCRSTMQAKTMAKVSGTAEGIRTRAAIADMRGRKKR